MNKLYKISTLLMVTVALLFTGFSAKAQGASSLTTFVWSASSGTGDWSTVANWSYRDPSSLTTLIQATRLPGSGSMDEVEIPATVNGIASLVNITSASPIVINKLNINGDNLGQGKLVIGSTSTLSVSLTNIASNVNGASSNSTIVLALLGGAISNSGTLEVKSSVTQIGIQFRNANVAGAQQPTLTNLGTLNIASQGTGISFNTSGGTAVLDGSGTTKFDPAVMATRKAFDIISAGTININAGVYEAGNGASEPIGGLFTIAPGATGYPINLTIASSVAMVCFNSASACFDISGTTPTSGTNTINITNNGQISITGNVPSNTSAPGGIRIGGANTTALTTTFTNNGTINLSGTLRNWGAIGISGGSNRLINTGTINISNAGSAGASSPSLGIRIASTNNATSTNSGTISITNTDTNTGPGLSLAGGSTSTFENSGTITIGGTLAGTTGAAGSKLNNLQAGKIVYNLSTTTTTAADGALIFQNDGTIEGIGQFTAATATGNAGLFNSSTSVISPGRDNIIGQINIFGTAITLPGSIKIDVSSTSSRDVISFNSVTAPSVSVTGNIAINPINGFTPVNGNIVNILAAGGSGTNNITLTGATITSNWTLSGNNTKTISATFNATLPIKLVSFTGSAQQYYNLIKWQTAAEENNKGFVLEKSTDGLKWDKIAFIAGKGLPSNYEYADRNIVKIAYYRIVQTDLNGDVSVYGPISVTSIITDDINVNIYPNPTQDYLNLVVNDILFEKARVNIYSITGQMVFSIDYRNQPIDISKLSSGKYILELQNNNKVLSRVFIKQ